MGISKEGQYKEMMDEHEPGLTDSEDSDDEMVLESDEDSESEEHSDNKSDQVKIDHRRLKRFRIPEADDEESDSEECREYRKRVEKEIDTMLKERLEGPCHDSKWIPNSEDEELLKIHILKPMMKGCLKYTHFKSLIPAEIHKKIEQGVQLKNEELKYVSKTANDYLWAFKKLLYIWEKKLQADDPSLLSADNRLHVSQFFAFKERNFLAPYNVVDLLDEFIASPNNKCKCFEAYKCILSRQFKMAKDHIGGKKFRTPVTEEEKTWSEDEMFKAGGAMQRNLLNDITLLLTEFKVDKPFNRWLGEKMTNQAEKLENQSYYEGRKVPDASEAYSKWISHESTVATEKRILEAAKKGEVVTGMEMEQMTKYIVTKSWIKAGHRNDIMQHLTWEDYFIGRKKGPAAYPYRPVHHNPDVDPKNPLVAERLSRVSDEDTLIYNRPNPWSRDDLDPDDHMKDPEVFDVMKGICITVKFHKTGHKYPAYLWLSIVDHTFMMAYLEVSRIYLESIGIELSNSTPLFIDRHGGFFISKDKRLDLDSFCAIVGLPKASPYLARRMKVATVYNCGSGKFTSFGY